jgi:methionyl-tRNA formyltransferase
MTTNITPPHSLLKTPYKITFLLDKANDWIKNHLIDSNFFVSNSHYEFRISHTSTEVFNQDIVFILGYTKMLDNNFLSKNQLNVVIHESDLPQGKGFSPVQWQVLEGKREIPICLFEANDQVDSGDIIFKSSFFLSGYELYDEIRTAQAKATFNAIGDFLKIFPNFRRTKQSGSESSYPRRVRKDDELNIDQSIRTQFNKLRIANNEDWPAFFTVDSHKYTLKIYRSDES